MPSKKEKAERPKRTYKGVYSTKGVAKRKMTAKDKKKFNEMFKELNASSDDGLSNIPVCLGRPRAFDTPAEMWGAFVEYFNWNKEHPWYKWEFKGKKWHQVPLGRPLSIEAFCMRQGVASSYLRSFIDNLKTTDPQYQNFSTVIGLIREACRRQKLEGAYVGVFNATIAALDLGLKKDNEGATGSGGLNVETSNEGDSALLDEVKKMLSDIDTQHNNKLLES